MNQDPKVVTAYESGNQNQWSRILLYFRDGAKRTLLTKRLTIVVGILFAVFAILSALTNVEDSNAVKVSTQNLSADYSLQETKIDIPAFASTLKEKLGIKKKTVKQISSGPIIISRPRVSEIPPGSMIKAVLLSGASNGPVKVQTVEPLIINNETLLDEGVTLFGRGSSTEERLILNFKKVIFQNGESVSINAEGCDIGDKIAGLKGEKLSKKALILGASLGFGALGGISQGLQEAHNQGGMLVTDPSLKNAALNGASMAAVDESRNLMEELKATKPIIEVKAGTQLYILFEDNQQ